MASIIIDTNLYDAVALYAKERQTSVDRLVEDYVVSLLKVRNEPYHAQSMRPRKVSISAKIRNLSGRFPMSASIDTKALKAEMMAQQYENL